MREGQWHARSVVDALDTMATDARVGLTADAVRRRLARYGPNELVEGDRISPFFIFIKQFQDFMVLVLVAAAAVSALLGEWTDATAIGIIVLLNGLLGFVQEYRAERSMEALRDMTAPGALVWRDGEEKHIPLADVVPGDVVLLFEGDRVPADGRLIEAGSLAADEAVLTGESAPVAKNAAAVHSPTTPVGDRTNMLYKGTAISRGRGRMLVTSTGMNTEIGRIADMIGEAEPRETPLQRRLGQLGQVLVSGCLAIVAIVFAIGVWQGFPVYRMFLTAVSLAVAAIPEGLPAVVTISLALGVQQMLRRRAIVRRLPAVETLGCATVICSDKTGTLTRNEMTVTRLWTPTDDVVVAEDASFAAPGPPGTFSTRRTAKNKSAPVDPRQHADLSMAIRIGAVCNHARLRKQPGTGQWSVLGDPTEGALLVLAEKAGMTERKRSGAIVDELPFDSYRKRMSVVVRDGGRLMVMAKGAPGLLLQRCDRVQRGGRVEPLTAKERRRIVRAVDEMAGQALRVLALAYAERGGKEAGMSMDESWETDLVFVGLVGMIDPPRTEARGALRVARKAGIRTIMITGDHPHTAGAIAQQLGIIGAGERVATGTSVDGWSDDELGHNVGRIDVFARVSPAHKLRIVRALRAEGEIVAMTGDGVNDAPAVKEADIGVAMGRTGTDVTREASDMILADDNYATIVAAVEEGRGIYDNIRKFIRYLLGCNVGEVLTMFVAALSGLPLPLLPMQILWMNLVTDGLPAIALGMERPDPDSMQRPPRAPDEGIFSDGLHVKIATRGVIIAVCALAVYVFDLYVRHGTEAHARTLAFTTLVVVQLIYVFQCRTPRGNVFSRRTFQNRYVVAAASVSLAMQLVVLYVPVLQQLFRVVPLTGRDWFLLGIVSGWYIALDALLRAGRGFVRRRFAFLRA